MSISFYRKFPVQLVPVSPETLYSDTQTESNLLIPQLFQDTLNIDDLNNYSPGEQAIKIALWKDQGVARSLADMLREPRRSVKATSEIISAIETKKWILVLQLFQQYDPDCLNIRRIRNFVFENVERQVLFYRHLNCAPQNIKELFFAEYAERLAHHISKHLPLYPLLFSLQENEGLKTYVFQLRASGNSLLCMAVYHRNPIAIEQLIALGNKNPELQLLIFQPNGKRQTPLALAIMKNCRVESLALFKACDKDPWLLALLFKPSFLGSNTPLQIAILKEDITAIQFMLNKCRQFPFLHELLFQSTRGCSLPEIAYNTGSRAVIDMIKNYEAFIYLRQLRNTSPHN